MTPLTIMREDGLDYCDTGVASAAENMALDASYLATLGERQRPLLHAYSWDGACATYGYFCDPAVWLDLTAAAATQLQLARRPTGGGITWHVDDLAFSFLLPRCHPCFQTSTLANYHFVNTAVAAAIARWQATRQASWHGSAMPAMAAMALQPSDAHALSDGCRHFCMARPTRYDVVVDGRKVGGAAQRRTAAGYLHQGSILLAWPKETFWRPLLRDDGVWKAMQSHSLPLLGVGHATDAELASARTELMAHLRATLTLALRGEAHDD